MQVTTNNNKKAQRKINLEGIMKTASQYTTVHENLLHIVNYSISANWIKIIMKYQLTPKNVYHKKTRTHREKNPFKLLVQMWGNIVIMRNNVDVSEKLKTELPNDLTIPILCIHSKEACSFFWGDIYTPMCLRVLFPIAKKWK